MPCRRHGISHDVSLEARHGHNVGSVLYGGCNVVFLEMNLRTAIPQYGMGRLFFECCLLFQLFPKSDQSQTCVHFGVWNTAGDISPPFRIGTCELVNWLRKNL